MFCWLQCGQSSGVDKVRRNKIIEEIENSQMNEIPEFSPGDTVSVQVLVKEGTRERLQAYEGVESVLKSAD